MLILRPLTHYPATTITHTNTNTTNVSLPNHQTQKCTKVYVCDMTRPDGLYSRRTDATLTPLVHPNYYLLTWVNLALLPLFTTPVASPRSFLLTGTCVGGGDEPQPPSAVAPIRLTAAEGGVRPGGSAEGVGGQGEGSPGGVKMASAARR